MPFIYPIIRVCMFLLLKRGATGEQQESSASLQAIAFKTEDAFSTQGTRRGMLWVSVTSVHSPLCLFHFLQPAC